MTKNWQVNQNPHLRHFVHYLPSTKSFLKSQIRSEQSTKDRERNCRRGGLLVPSLLRCICHASQGRARSQGECTVHPKLVSAGWWLELECIFYWLGEFSKAGSEMLINSQWSWLTPPFRTLHLLYKKNGLWVLTQVTVSRPETPCVSIRKYIRNSRGQQQGDMYASCPWDRKVLPPSPPAGHSIVETLWFGQDDGHGAGQDWESWLQGGTGMKCGWGN